MKTAGLWMGLSIAMAAGATAQELPRSPYDTNPKCTERNTAPDDHDCVVPRDGTPRHTYPPPRRKDPAPPPPPEQPSNPPTLQKDFKSPRDDARSR